MSVPKGKDVISVANYKELHMYLALPMFLNPALRQVFASSFLAELLVFEVGDRPPLGLERTNMDNPSRALVIPPKGVISDIGGIKGERIVSF
jgi:hypothetical protein